MRKRGFSIPLAIVAGSVLLLSIQALSMFSSREMGQVKTLLGRKKAEYAAQAGLAWASSQLFQKRWYQPATSQFAAPGQRWKWSHREDPDLFPDEPGLGVTVYLDEVPSTKTLIVPGKQGKLRLLDHIRILAIGHLGREQAVVFGRFLICPEPLLCSNSTVGHPPETPLEAIPSSLIPLEVPFPPPLSGATPGYGDPQLKVKAILKDAGAKVQQGQEIATLGTKDGRLFPLVATHNGTVKLLLLTPGRWVSARAQVGDLERDPEPQKADFTLRKMARVIRLLPEVFRGRNLDDVQQRYSVYAQVAALSDAYIRNYVASRRVIPLLQTVFAGMVAQPAVAEDELIAAMQSARMPTPPSFEEGSKQFIIDLLTAFSPPFGLPATIRRAFPSNTVYSLDCGKANLSEELTDLLIMLGPLHRKDYLAMLQSRPRQDFTLYQIASTPPFLDRMDPNRVALTRNGVDAPAYIASLSWLPEGAVKVTVALDQGAPFFPTDVDTAVSKVSLFSPLKLFEEEPYLRVSFSLEEAAQTFSNGWWQVLSLKVKDGGQPKILLIGLKFDQKMIQGINTGFGHS